MKKRPNYGSGRVVHQDGYVRNMRHWPTCAARLGYIK